MKRTAKILRVFSLAVATILTLTTICLGACAPQGGDSTQDPDILPIANTETEKEFNSFINDLSSFPVRFTYDEINYRGFNPQEFKKESATVTKSEDKDTVSVNITVRKSESFKARIEATLYRSYNAFDYTVYFENDSAKNSEILSNVNSFDYYIKGEKPYLKGILGDHKNKYAPYEYVLAKRSVTFKSTLGRATHEYFPYFNVETDDGGYMIALGWGGTWESDFSKYKKDEGTHVVLKSCIGFSEEGTYTYLEPGETYRTALIGVVRYYERDEDLATNAWRRWMVDCNLPRDNADTDEPVAPSMSSCLAADSDRPNSDGSISEYSGSWKRSLDAMYENGLYLDFRWFDAGWYFDPEGNTVPSDWYGTVGAWELDTVKWPNGSFRDSVDYARAHGAKTLVWFEPERVTHIYSLMSRHNYKQEWAIPANSKYLNNLGNKECLEWTLNKIIKFMRENDIDLYREDFNVDPAYYWEVGDVAQGFERYGMTENLYMQGHYSLWDGIIEYCAANGKCTYVDSCASGGGRNDLESVRRSVPLLRSDSDRTTIPLKLAYTTTLCKWLPYTGACAKDTNNELGNSNLDTYIMRACFLPHMNISGRWYHDKENLPWAEIVKCREEWLEASKYFLKDFYVLTSYMGIDADNFWTAYMYWDTETDSGLLQAFRQKNCDESRMTLNLKGVNPDRYYRVRDIDGKQSVDRVLGAELINGFTVSADSVRTALVLYIEPVE